jgi:hypothetical protein
LPAAQPTSPLSAFLGQHCKSSAPLNLQIKAIR